MRELNDCYLDTICLQDEIINGKMEDGRKVLFLRDSYSSPLAVFLSPMCKEIDLRWTVRTDGETIEKNIEEEVYDYIFVALAIDNFTNEGIPFYADEVAEELEGLSVLKQ